ncbi:MAG: long-chain fatty acid--CoA ligase [Chloroflexi bacterium]|nr:long-chain fatty acid--CoA ligase [Chloroflexota bacterium]MBP8055391.1 long-chain fatty acid--CoA ligase [Chloroflexota bacterium]
MEETVLKKLHDHARMRPQDPAYHVKKDGQWVATNWQTYCQEIRQTSRALMALGFKPNDKVCILGFNRPEWTIMALGGMLSRGAAAGIYITNSPGEVKYIVDHAEAPIILLEDEGQWEKIKQIRADVPTLKYAVMMKNAPKINDPMALSWEEFLAKGNEVAESRVDENLNLVKPEDLATLIYTSGTTGPPKAVMLSHKAVYTVSRSAKDLFNLEPNDRQLSYLPLSHIAEQMFTLHAALVNGYQVYYAESGAKVAENVREVEPTILFGVPRVWERFHTGVANNLNQNTGLKAKIAHWAQGVGSQVTALHHQGKQPSGLLAMQYALADRLVFAKVKERTGLGKAKIIVTGAAPISREILDFFGSLDVRIYEVYGLSESCGVLSFNLPGKAKVGSVGPVWPLVEMKLGNDGEIIARGPAIMMGYYKDPVATAETLMDGWLYTGDLGSFDKDGFLSITGRKKEIIITSGGKNIAPKNIESALTDQPLIAEAIIIGEQRRYLTALLTLEQGAAAKLAEELGVPLAELTTHPSCLAEIQKAVEKVNSLFAKVEHVRRFTVLPQNFSVEGGELTPTLKLKRRIIHKKYEAIIESMYTDGSGE